MVSFSEGVWNIVIFVGTLGGIFGLFLLTNAMTKDSSGKKANETTGHVWDEDLADLNNPLPRWWLNMFYLTMVFGVFYLIFFPGIGSNNMLLDWTQVKQYEKEMAAAEAKYGPIFEEFLGTDLAALAKDPAANKVGERLYASYCSTCHGSDARGGAGFPNLADDDWLYGGTPEIIEQTILDGRDGNMPGWEQVLGGEAGVKNVSQYVLSLAGREHDQAAAAAGKPLYDQICVACHQAAGTGNEQLGAPNLSNGIWLYGGSEAAIAESIAKGRQGKMPAHREFLGEAKVHVLAAYIYGLSQ